MGDIDGRWKHGGKVILEMESWEETFSLGKKLGEMSRPGETYVLVGDLGTGKTVFTQGFARGLGIAGPVNSPTFTILQIYEEGRLPLYHFDVYRIEDIEEMEEIGCEDCFYGKGVCLIEWGNLIREILPAETVWVAIEKNLDRGFDYRKISIERKGTADNSSEGLAREDFEACRGELNHENSGYRQFGAGGECRRCRK